ASTSGSRRKSKSSRGAVRSGHGRSTSHNSTTGPVEREPRKRVGRITINSQTFQGEFMKPLVLDDVPTRAVSLDQARVATVNPSTGKEIEAFSYFTSAQIEKVVARADKSFQSFRKLSVHKRAHLLADLGNTLRKNKAQLAKVITTEMGKILPEAEAEIEKCAREADWYAEHGPKIMADEPAPTGTVNAYVSYLPLGTILA